MVRKTYNLSSQRQRLGYVKGKQKLPRQAKNIKHVREPVKYQSVCIDIFCPFSAKALHVADAQSVAQG